MIRQILALVAVMLLAVAPVAVAQDYCEGTSTMTRFDGRDAAVFKGHFGRGGYQNPCPPMAQHHYPTRANNIICHGR